MSACAARENVITSRAAGRPGGRWSFADDVRRVPSPALLELLVVYSAGRRSTARTAGLSMPQLPTLQTSRRDELTSKCVRRTAPVRPSVAWQQVAVVATAPEQSSREPAERLHHADTPLEYSRVWGSELLCLFFSTPRNCIHVHGESRPTYRCSVFSTRELNVFTARRYP